MKNLKSLLSLLLLFSISFIACQKGDDSSTSDSAIVSKSSKGHNADLTTFSPVLTATAGAGVINLSWDFAGLPDGNIVKWVNVARKYTDANGQIYTDPNSGKDFIIIQSFWEQFWYPNYVLNYTDTNTRPLDYNQLLSGTYEYQLLGSYGDPNDSQSSIGYFSNNAIVVIP